MKSLVLKIADHPDVLIDFTKSFFVHHFFKSNKLAKIILENTFPFKKWLILVA